MEDVKGVIRMAIIKGVNKNHPHWYRIHISAGNVEENSQPGTMLYSTSQLHEMNAESSQNLEIILEAFKYFKSYTLYPAKAYVKEKRIEPYFDKGIRKKELIVKYAWEIGEGDHDFIVLKFNDEPYIPTSVAEAPVLKALEKKRMLHARAK